MHLSRNAQVLLISIAIPLTFIIGAGTAACVIHPVPPAAPSMPATTAADLVVAYARKHPDSAISGSFGDKLKSGEIKIVVEKPKEHAMASFGRSGKGYALTIDPERLKSEPTVEEFETTLSILSHEHAHYRQFVEGEMSNYHPQGVTMTETQCTLVILVEIDAHGKACRDAQAYGWTSRTAKSACERTMATIAGYLLTERGANFPECGPVWTFYFKHVPGARVDKPKARASSRLVKTRSGAIYMPPP